jgi:hypothetical protein
MDSPNSSVLAEMQRQHAADMAKMEKKHEEIQRQHAEMRRQLQDLKDKIESPPDTETCIPFSIPSDFTNTDSPQGFATFYSCLWFFSSSASPPGLFISNNILLIY